MSSSSTSSKTSISVGLFTAAQKLKKLSQYSESEITNSLSNCNFADIELFHEQLEMIHENIEPIPQTKAKSQITKLTKATKSEKTAGIIKQIKHSLAIYESSDKIDKWRINFKIGCDYSQTGKKKLTKIHESLVLSGNICGRVRLLSFWERGRMYSCLKNVSPNWEKLCEELGICRSTTYRYMRFSDIISNFPRLIICDLSFEAIVFFGDEIIQYLNCDNELSMKLHLPLREIELQADIKFQPIPISKELEESASTEIKNLDWSPHYSVSDNL